MFIKHSPVCLQEVRQDSLESRGPDTQEAKELAAMKADCGSPHVTNVSAKQLHMNTLQTQQPTANSRICALSV